MIKKLLFLFIWVCISKTVQSQFEHVKDSVVQLYGVVMTADSLKGLPSVSIIVKGSGRGTISNDYGVFSIVVLKGDEVEFSSIGYKSKQVFIPKNIEGSQYSIIQLLISDTAYLPATVLKPRPSRTQFERDFVNTQIPADQYEIARQNTNEATRRLLLQNLPADGKEAVNFSLRQQANKYYYAGQTPPIGLLNPLAWADFIQAWKRGDFKKKK